MRRATMAGAPQKYSVSGERDRSTLSEDPRRKLRNVRDKAYQTSCINSLMDFLVQKEYDRPISTTTLSNPSLKEFQSIFRYIHGYIDPSSDYSRKFEEEVVLFLRGIKYPYASEINRSQLIAITPHTWPVLLSMLAWMATLVDSIEKKLIPTTTMEDEVKGIFYTYLYKEYSAYMEGRDNEESSEKSVTTSLSEIHKEKLSNILSLKSKEEKLLNDINNLNDSSEHLERIKEKEKQIDIDIQKLTQLKHHNESKLVNYRESLNEAKSFLEKTLNELSGASSAKNELEHEIKHQPIKQEDIQEMTEERDLLIKHMEESKREKTILIREIEKLNQKVRISVEETEKLLFDLSSINQETKLKIIRKRINTDLLEYDEFSVEGNIKEEHSSTTSSLDHFTRAHAETESLLEKEKERNQMLTEKEKNLSEEISQRKERAKVHAQIYIEKREASEEEYRRAVGRVDKAEAELMKILVDGDNGLFQSEQNLERVKIKKGRISSRIAAEQAEIERISSLTSSTLHAVKERISETFSSLL